MKLPHYCFQRQNSCPGLTDAVPRLWSITLRITKPTSSSRLCQIGQTIKSKAWQASKPARPGSHRPQLPAHGGPDWPEPPHPRLRPEADILQRKRKEKPRARTADLRAINATSPPPPGARAPKAKLPSCSLSRSRHRSPRLPPPSAVSPRPSEAGSLGRSLRRGTTVPAPTRAACGSCGQGEPSGATSRPSSLPAFRRGRAHRGAASEASFRPAPPRSRGAILWGCGAAPVGVRLPGGGHGPPTPQPSPSGRGRPHVATCPS